MYIYIFGFTIHLYGGLIGPFCFSFCFLSTDLFQPIFSFLSIIIFNFFSISFFFTLSFQILAVFCLIFFLSFTYIILFYFPFHLFSYQFCFSFCSQDRNIFPHFILFNYCISEENKMACGQTRVSNRFMEVTSPAGVCKESR